MNKYNSQNTPFSSIKHPYLMLYPFYNASAGSRPAEAIHFHFNYIIYAFNLSHRG